MATTIVVPRGKGLNGTVRDQAGDEGGARDLGPGRPLVHAKISPDECERRYRQINDFERMLVEEGATILKFFCTSARMNRNGD